MFSDTTALVTLLRPYIAYGSLITGVGGLLMFAWGIRYRTHGSRIREFLSPKPWFTNMQVLRPKLHPPGWTFLFLGMELMCCSLLYRIMFLGWDNWWWMP